MKCQHCGIHFDDDERVCPMCGARAGTKGRMSKPEPKWHGKPRETYTEYHPTIENSSSVKTAKSKSRPLKDKPRKKKGRWGLVVTVLAILTILPNLFAFVIDEILPDFVDHWGASYTADYNNSDSYDDSDDSTYGYDDAYDTFRDALGENGITASAYGNVYTLKAEDDGDSYEFAYTESDGSRFCSTGTAFCYREDDEDYYYREEYPFEEYIMYSVYLYPEHQEAKGTRPDWCDFLLQSKVDSIALTVFQSRTTDEVVVEDMDGVGLFGSGNVMHFNKV